MADHRKTWRIQGKKKLSGTVRVHGNKNTALPAMAASLLLPHVGDVLTLTHIPQIRDVVVMSEVLSFFGIISHWNGSSLTLTREKAFKKMVRVPKSVISRIRGSIILLGPLAGIWSHFTLPKPGGDRIGIRPITAHLTALEDMGVRATDARGVLKVSRKSMPRGRLVKVWLTEQSVTATEITLLYSAFLDRSQTLEIYDAACEPHIVSLCGLLRSMGATVTGLRSNLLSIHWPRGVREPRSAFRLDDDFMEASTFAVAAAVTKSDIVISFAHPEDLVMTNRFMNWLGVKTELDTRKKQWRIRGRSSSLTINSGLSVIKAEPWPRFHTDIMSLFVVLATQCTGTLKFIEYMYDDRFGFSQALKDMGARIRQEGPHVIHVEGRTPLGGNEMLLRPDIRSGAAMLLAALAADGTSVLHDRKGVIARGYQDLPGDLARLGAHIEEIEHLFE